MNLDRFKPDIPEPDKTALQAQYQKDSLACCSNLRQNQQLSGHLQPSAANATAQNGLGKCSKPLDDFPHRNKQPDSSEQEYYLCEYSFEGDRYSLEILAKSWSEAEAKLRRMSYGKVVGKIDMVMPVQAGWIAKTLVWLKNLAED